MTDKPLRYRVKLLLGQHAERDELERQAEARLAALATRAAATP